LFGVSWGADGKAAADQWRKRAASQSRKQNQNRSVSGKTEKAKKQSAVDPTRDHGHN
jgi:hypothetical protein